MALFGTPLCIFITNSQPSAYLLFAEAPPLLHHSILSHLYSESSLPLVILHPSISPRFSPALSLHWLPFLLLMFLCPEISFFLFSIPAEEC